MNFSPLDQSKSSSDETDRITDEIDDTAARSYGCIFCKRGFTTAQALGGHMNIHRKDRNKTNPSSSSSSSPPIPPLIMSSDHELTYNYVSVGQSYNNYQPPFYHPYASEPYTGLPVSGRTSYYSFPAAQFEDHRLNQGVSDDRGLIWGQTLNLQGGALRVGDDDHGGAPERDATVSEEDVDLELRLGYA